MAWLARLVAGPVAVHGVQLKVKPAGFSALLVVIAAACGDVAPNAEQPAAETPAESTVASVAGSPAPRFTHAKRIAWPVSFESAGPLRPGMSLAQAVIAMEGDLWTPDTQARCLYFYAARAPGMNFVFLDRHLVRIEVDSGTAATVERVKIGATEEEVQAAYPDHVIVTDAAYSGGHFLTVSAPDSADTVRKLVFETDGKRVIRFRTGLRPAVDWIEGCS